MAVTPATRRFGLAAPIIITLARLLQGFSVGGEFGSAVSFPRRAWRRAARVQRQLAICNRRHHHGYRLRVRCRSDVVVDP